MGLKNQKTGARMQQCNAGGVLVPAIDVSLYIPDCRAQVSWHTDHGCILAPVQGVL